MNLKKLICAAVLVFANSQCKVADTAGAGIIRPAHPAEPAQPTEPEWTMTDTEFAMTGTVVEAETRSKKNQHLAQKSTRKEKSAVKVAKYTKKETSKPVAG
jgi:hypothetical protein